MKANIRPEIAQLACKIDEVSVHPRNPRRGDLDELTRSLTHHGQYKPVFAQKSTGHLLLGNHTWQAAKNLGWDKIAVVFLDVSDDQATRILLVDNRTSDLGRYDDDVLTGLLQELAVTDGELDGTGWDEGALEDLAKMLEPPDLDDLARKHGAPEHDDGWATLKIRVPRHIAAAWREYIGNGSEVAALAELLGVGQEWDS